jgi:hypothetical protein
MRERRGRSSTRLAVGGRTRDRPRGSGRNAGARRGPGVGPFDPPRLARKIARGWAGGVTAERFAAVRRPLCGGGGETSIAATLPALPVPPHRPFSQWQRPVSGSMIGA